MSSDTLSQVCYKSRCKVLSSAPKYMSVIYIKYKFLYIVFLFYMCIYYKGRRKCTEGIGQGEKGAVYSQHRWDDGTRFGLGVVG